MTQRPRPAPDPLLDAIASTDLRVVASVANPGCRSLMSLAEECREIVERARQDLGDDLPGGLLDLVADNIPGASLADLRAALVVAGLEDPK